MRLALAFQSLFCFLLLLLGAFFLVYYDRGPASVYAGRLGELGVRAGEAAAVYEYIDGGDSGAASLGFLSPRERAHLRDVRAYLLAAKLLLVFLALLAGLLLSRRSLERGSLRLGALASLSLALALLASSLIGWTSFWDWFHRLFFPQGNWRFPAGSPLVSLFPGSFFARFTIHVLLALSTYSLLVLFFLRRESWGRGPGGSISERLARSWRAGMLSFAGRKEEG